jgi:hypothetical protein
MHITTLAAMEPLWKVDGRTRAGVAPGTPASAAVLSIALATDIAPGGVRSEDYRGPPTTLPAAPANKPGLRLCAD